MITNFMTLLQAFVQVYGTIVKFAQVLDYHIASTLLYTSAIVTSAALTIDVAMYSIGSTIKDVKSSFK